MESRFCSPLAHLCSLLASNTEKDSPSSRLHDSWWDVSVACERVEILRARGHLTASGCSSTSLKWLWRNKHIAPLPTATVFRHKCFDCRCIFNYRKKKFFSFFLLLKNSSTWKYFYIKKLVFLLFTTVNIVDDLEKPSFFIALSPLFRDERRKTEKNFFICLLLN